MSNLILVPTPIELDELNSIGNLSSHETTVGLCGFGPIAAAARAAQLITIVKPRRALLVGIAGSHAPTTHPVGSAHFFDSVVVEGIGAGWGHAAVDPRSLGIAQWDPAWESHGSNRTGAIYDHLPLTKATQETEAGQLLSVCSASSDAEHAHDRRTRFPRAMAEDMEAFAVALACQLHSIDLTVVRGISNLAGDRDKSRWQIRQSLAQAHALTRAWLEDPASVQQP